MMAYFIQRQIQIERIMSYWAAGICSLIAIFVLFHWARWLCVKVERSRRPAGVIGRPFVATTRYEMRVWDSALLPNPHLPPIFYL